MKLLLSLTLLLAVSNSTFASVDDFEILDDINEMSPVKIKEIRELLKNIPKDATCMDEYLKRRNQPKRFLLLNFLRTMKLCSPYQLWKRNNYWKNREKKNFIQDCPTYLNAIYPESSR